MSVSPDIADDESHALRAMKWAGGSIPAMGSLRYSPAFAGLVTPDQVNPVGRLKELIMTRLLRQTRLLVRLSAISSFAATRTVSSMRRAVAAPSPFSFTLALVKSAGAAGPNQQDFTTQGF